MPTLPFLLLIAFLNSAAHAAGKPVCGLEHVTRNCKFFAEKASEAFIKLPDGGMIVNPLYQEPKVTAKTENLSPAETARMREEYFLQSAEVLDAFKGPSFSTAFKLSFISCSYPFITKSKPTVRIAWPPNVPNAQYQEVKISEIVSYLQKNMASADYQTLLQKSFQLNQRLIADDLRARKEELGHLKEDFAADQTRAKKKERIRVLFQDTKNQLADIIRRGKKDHELSEEQKVLLEKIATTRLAEMDTKELNDSPWCANNAKNAFYVGDTHTINICPGHVLSADSSLVTVLAHEMGHSIDPCHARMPLWKVDAKKREKLLASSDLNSSEKELLNSIAPKGVTNINYDFRLYIRDPKVLDRVVRTGVFQRLNSGVTAEKYPFAPELSCFVKKNLIPETTQADVDNTVTFIKSHKIGQSDQRLDSQIVDRYLEGLKEYPQCLSNSGPATQVNETISDMFSAVLNEKFVIENSFRSEAEKVAAVPFTEQQCSSNNLATITPYSFGESLSRSMKDNHADFQKRVQITSLNLPGMAKLYDCTRTVPGCFDHLSFSGRIRTNVSPTLTKEGKK